MAQSSIASNVLAAISLVVISCFVLLLLRHYLPLRKTPAYLLVPVFLALALPLSIILLVPIDLASIPNEEYGQRSAIWLPQTVILVAWRISYWLTFLLTWIVLPILGEYSDSGYRDPRSRLIYSLRSNGRYQLIVLGTLILGGLYLFLSYGLHGQSPKALVMALAYTWGLILAIYLMGHGMVAIPRNLFRSARNDARLRQTQAHAVKVHDRLEEAMEELSAVEGQIAQLQDRRHGLSPDLKDWVDEVVETSSNTRGSYLPRTAGAAVPTVVPTVVTERYMADLTRKLKRARHKAARFKDEWSSVVDAAIDLEATVASGRTRRLTLPSMAHHKTRAVITPQMRYVLHDRVLPPARLGLSFIFALSSVTLLLSEITHPFSSKLSILGLTVVHQPNSSHLSISFLGQITSALWLLYMCTCALYSLSSVKIWGNRALVRRATYPESATWYALQVAKLTVPLSFNFITMLPATVYSQTSFFQFLGKLIDLTPLGKSFSAYFPIFILVPVCASLFNLYAKVQKMFGFGALLDDDDGIGGTDGAVRGWREGAALIQREIADRFRTGVGVVPLSAARPEHEAGTERYADRVSLDLPGRHSNDGRAPAFMPGFVGGGGAEPVSGRAPGTAVQADRATVRDASRYTDDNDDSPRYFFQDLGERMRNTFESVERPEWLGEIGDALTTKPKWLNGDGASRGGEESVFSRMFGSGSGGGQGSGNVRI